MGVKLVSKRTAGCVLAALILVAGAAGPAAAITPKQPTELGAKAFFLPELYISSSQLPVGAVLTELPNKAAWQSYLEGFSVAGLPAPQAFIDPRSGAATNIVTPVPLIPGGGVGNLVSLEEVGARIGRPVTAIDATVVADAVLAHVLANQTLLGVDPAQLGAVRAARVGQHLWQARVPQTFQGIPVRHGHLVATINRGNLVLVGTEAWGNVELLSTTPNLTADEAVAAGMAYAGGAAPADVLVKHPALEIVPFAPLELQSGEAFSGPLGRGYRHRLVWSFAFRRPPSHEVWEVLVDARGGEVIAFEDLNQYANEQVTGGVYPVTSTEICPTPGTCGDMRSGWPMPFADTGQAAPNNFTNSAGVFFHTGGATTTTLSGQYVNINDNCGSVSESDTGSIDLGGANGQHDCTSAGASAGDTPASRTAFYELNKQIEQGRGWLPANSWLQSQLTSNVNINNTCNAFWSFGGTVNFYRSGGGCRNTGELAGVFDHEWGHGLDDNDAGGSLSNSSEAYADIAAIYRLQDSCVGHGFFETVDDGCGMTSDGTGFNSNENQVGGSHCDLDCSGVRDADWARHNPATPDTALGFVCNECLSSSGPCGRQVHCAAAPSRQAAWDFVRRDLQDPPFSYDDQTAFLVGNKVFYQGSGNIGLWHACSCGSSSDGCGATNAYMQWLAADDDDGNVNNGTPHMTALFDAFDRHGIACSTPTPTNSGCAGGPTGAATLNATPGNNAVDLSWSGVAGADDYWVLRTEGHAGCDFGKAVIATLGGGTTDYTDTEVANGRDYSYNVVAVGTPDACFGAVSNCETVQPVGSPDFTVSCVPASHSIEQGTSAVSTCTVSAEFGYTGSVDLSCSGQPAGIGCTFVPSTVSPTANSTLTLDVDLAQATGLYNFDVVADDGTLNRTTAMSVNVTPEGQNGPQVAVFDATYQAPACLVPGSECDTVTGVDSRDSLSPAEPNQPNTIADSCADGTSGSYHSDESNDRIVVKTLDGFDMAEGATVQIDATVYAWNTGSSDTVDFFYTADASSPSWTLIGSQVTPSGGLQTISTQYTLPAGAIQAVRVQFRYQSTNAPCSAGSYNDRDDLVFAVNPSASCTIDADCDDGAFCNGAEVCNAGTCEAGTPPACDDGLYCNGDESCNETTDSCDAGTPPACDDGLFCNGDETCNETTDSCDAGTPPACDDGAFCNGTETCNESTDSCDAGTPVVCEDGVFCNGFATCDEGSDACVPGPPPSCDDGVGCTDDSCNVGTDSCANVTNDANCDNGEFCDGAETCDAVLDCQAGSDPCPGQICNETTDICEPSGPTPRLEAGTVTAGGTPVTVSLTNFYTSPVVVTTMQYRNNTQPTVTRVGNVTGTSFDLRLQNPSGGAVAAESVSYLVVEEGSWNIDGFQVEAQRVTSTVTDEDSSWVGEAQSYLGSYTNPVVLGQVMSENDAAWSVFWDRGTSRTSPPTATSLRIGKTVCGDTVTTRANETLGMVVFEAGHGTLGGVEFEAALGADTIRGVSNSPPYSYGFTTPFSSAPTVGLATMAAMDGADGGWAQIHGPTLATATRLYLSIDEDIIGDAERGHTTEQVGYAVFAGPVVYPSSPECAIDADCDDGLYCNGAETCNAGFCQAGTAPACDDGQFCNGAESCNESTDSCDAGTDPCVGGTCDEGTDTCSGIAVMEWGSVSVGGGSTTVNLANSYTSPVVVATVQYANNTVPVVTRIGNVTSSSFDIRLQNAGAGAVVADNVSYLVVEEGLHTVDGVAIEAQRYNSTVTDENNSWVGEARSYGQAYTSPVVLGQVMSENDPDWSVFWDRGPSRTSPPTASSLITGKTVCQDTLTTRANETIGIIVIESGHGTLGGVEFEAALGGDSVRGAGNSPPYAYAFSTPFASAPSVGIATMAAVDGGDGGWAQIHGPTLATGTSLYLSIDEDTIGDAERGHTTEQVGYLVFAAPGSAE